MLYDRINVRQARKQVNAYLEKHPEQAKHRAQLLAMAIEHQDKVKSEVQDIIRKPALRPSKLNIAVGVVVCQMVAA